MIKIFACVMMLDLISGVNSTCGAQPIVNVLSSLNPDTLYRFYPNKIDISGLRAGDIVRLSALRFRASGDTVLEYRVANRYIQSDTLRITRGKEQVFAKNYGMSDVTDPTAFLGGVTGKTATVSEILDAPFIVVRHPGCGYRGRHIIVTAFSLSTSRSRGAATPSGTHGPYLSAADIEEIRLLRKGGRVMISNIRAHCPGCTTRMLNDIDILIR